MMQSVMEMNLVGAFPEQSGEKRQIEAACKVFEAKIHACRDGWDSHSG